MMVRGRYTMSLHFFGCNNPANHIDLFLDSDGKSELYQFYVSFTEFKNRWRQSRHAKKFAFYVTCGWPHRRLYLDYQGPVSHGRGKLRKIKSGFFSAPLSLLQHPAEHAVRVKISYTRK